MICNAGYLSIGEILHKLLDMSQIVVCFCSMVLIPNFCFLGEMGHFSYVAFDCINKQRVPEEAQWKKRRKYQIAGDEDTGNDEDKNDVTLEDYHSDAY